MRKAIFIFLSPFSRMASGCPNNCTHRPALAANICRGCRESVCYASLDYAAQFGFEPQSDWTQSQYLLEPRGELEEPYQLIFGVGFTLSAYADRA